MTNPAAPPTEMPQFRMVAHYGEIIPGRNGEFKSINEYWETNGVRFNQVPTPEEFERAWSIPATFKPYTERERMLAEAVVALSGTDFLGHGCTIRQYTKIIVLAAEIMNTKQEKV